MNKGICVIVESRIIPNFREIVENHIKYTGWDVVVVCGELNAEYMFDELEGLNATMLPLASDVKDGWSYNKLLTNYLFWQVIPNENVLIFQHDSRLLRSGIEEFMQYDFVGAPIFHPHLPMPCQNGGLSFRHRSKMLEVLNTSSWDSTKANEDIFYCRELEKIGANLPTKEVAEKFSVESIYSLGSMGYHAIEKYLTPLQCCDIKNQYL